MADTVNIKTSRLLDQQFGVWVARNFPGKRKASDVAVLQRIAEAVSYATHLKHSCLDIEHYLFLNDAVLNTLLKDIDVAQVKKIISADVKPLVCSSDGKKTWLQKYHHFEQKVAQDLLAMKSEDRIDIITGGPGTGKTWTAAQYIREKLVANPDALIALAAPTGKAANNIMNALEKEKIVSDRLKSLTLHSLLGINGRSPKPGRNKQNLLTADFIVIDEASMIDLPMMYRFLQAVPSHARLLLLGDKDQLASVEAGSVLHEICNASALVSSITTLVESRRYQASPEIGVLATALNRGEVPDMSGNHKVRLHTLSSGDAWNSPWLKEVLTYYARLNNATVAYALEQQKQFQILCALREGPQGVKGINAMIEKALHHAPHSWYVGKPLMITANHPERKLYNGDVGMVLSIDGVLKACFQIDGQVKMISQSQMPDYETCYAMTVHKSQGSEYKHVLIVLPDDLTIARYNPVLTRELVYTAVTRAIDKIDIWCGKGVLENAASKTLQRMSGLNELISKRE